jgi:hypothetical protein
MKLIPTLQAVKAKFMTSKHGVNAAIPKKQRTFAERRDEYRREYASKLSTVFAMQFDAEKASDKEHLYSDPHQYRRAVVALSQYSAVVAENQKIKETDSALAVADAVSNATRNLEEQRNAILDKMYWEAAPQDRVKTCLLLAEVAVRGLPRSPASDCVSYLYRLLLGSSPLHQQNKPEYEDFAFLAEHKIGDYAKSIMSYEALMDGLIHFAQTSTRSKLCSIIYAQVLEDENCVALPDRDPEKTSDAMSVAFAKFVAYTEEEWFISEGNIFIVEEDPLGI